MEMFEDDKYSDDEAEGEDVIQRLVEGVDLRELTLSGSEFTVQVNEDSAIEEQITYEGPKLAEHMNMECVGQDEDDAGGYTHETPFDCIASKMFNLTSDGKVKKRILTEGYGEIVPPNSLVWFHHNNYMEFAEVPFDSSYMRGEPCKLRLNSGICIPGLDIGLSTMKRDEKAEFLIHHDYAYGKLGIPPRIHPEAEVLIQVELKKFVDNSDALKMGELTEEELKSLSFGEIYKGAHGLLREGNTAFSEKKWRLAVKLYRSAVRTLENCDMESDEHELKNEELRLRLYCNLGVVYNKMNRPKNAISVCRDALKLKPNAAKIFYHLGLAHLQLSSFDEAKKFAFLARKQEPRNKDISKLLQMIEDKMAMYQESSISFAKSAFKDMEVAKEDKVAQNKPEAAASTSHRTEPSFNLPGNAANKDSRARIVEQAKEEKVQIKNANEESSALYSNAPSPDREFKLEALRYIEDFFNDPTERELAVPSGLTYEEELFFHKQSQLYSLKWKEKEERGKTVLYLIK